MVAEDVAGAIVNHDLDVQTRVVDLETLKLLQDPDVQEDRRISC